MVYDSCDSYGSWNNDLRVVQFVHCISLERLSGSHALRTKNIRRVLRFGAFTFSERRICIVCSMFVSPAIHGWYEFGRIAYHQYVIYAVHQLDDSWTCIYTLSLPSNDIHFTNCTTRKPLFHDPYESYDSYGSYRRGWNAVLLMICMSPLIHDLYDP